MGAALAGFAVIASLAALFVARRDNWTVEQRHVVLALIAELAGVVVLTAATSVLAASLYALGDFLTPTASQGLRALLPLAGLAFVHSGYRAVLTLAALAVVGEASRALLLAARLRRKARSLEATEDAVADASVWRTSLPHAVNMVVVAVNPFVDRIVAASAIAGSLTVLDLGEKIFYVPVLAIGSSLVLTSGARWAELAHSDPDAAARDFRRVARTTAKASAALACVIVAVVGVAVLAGAGGAHGRDVLAVTAVLLVGLPAANVANLSARLLTSLRRTRVLPAFAVVSVATNLVCDVVGFALFGIVGIAAATVAMRSLNAVGYLVYIARTLPAEPRRDAAVLPAGVEVA